MSIFVIDTFITQLQSKFTRCCRSFKPRLAANLPLASKSHSDISIAINADEALCRRAGAVVVVHQTLARSSCTGAVLDSGTDLCMQRLLPHSHQHAGQQIKAGRDAVQIDVLVVGMEAAANQAQAVNRRAAQRHRKAGIGRPA